MISKFTKKEVYKAAVEIAILKSYYVANFDDTYIIQLSEFEFDVIFCYDYSNPLIIFVNMFKVKDKFRSIW